MQGKTLTRSDLSEMIYRKVGLSKTESSGLVDEIFQHISDALVNGEDVKLSSFGTFKLRDKNARIGRNPKTKEEVTIEPRRVLVFRPSQNMKDKMIDAD